MSHRDEPELNQYTGFDRTFVMPFDRELNGSDILVSVESVEELTTSDLGISGSAIVSTDVVLDDRQIYADKAIQVNIVDITAVSGTTYRIKFIGVDNNGKKIPLVGRLTILL